MPCPGILLFTSQHLRADNVYNRLRSRLSNVWPKEYGLCSDAGLLYCDVIENLELEDKHNYIVLLQKEMGTLLSSLFFFSDVGSLTAVSSFCECN